MRSLLKKNYVLFVVLMVLMVAIILLWFGKSRLKEYVEYHHSIAKGAVSGVAVQVAAFMEEQKRLVKLFANEHVEKISSIAANPDNDQLKLGLGKIIKQYFPNYFAFTVADNEGNPFYEDFDGLVSEMCVADMKSFAAEDQYLPHIHPNSEAYHFDVMAKFDDGNTQGILFISFHADVMGRILNSAQAPGHNVMLIYPKRSDLIEVVAEGARNHLNRNDYRLSDAEKARILESHDVDGTRWQAVDLNNDTLFSDFKKGLTGESLLLFVLFASVGGLMVMRLAKEEKQREVAEVKREEAEQNRRALISVIAHEFRTPVTAIVGSIGLLAEDLESMPLNEVRKFINMANQNTGRLQYLINDFLDLQKMESQGLSFAKEQVDLAALVRTSLEQNASYATQFGVSYQLQEAPDTLVMPADGKRIEQVMANLLSNAAKYGGNQQPVEVCVKVQGNMVRVSVKDFGPGIEPEFQTRVFDKFTTAPAAKSQHVKSTGLGLSICKAIIEGHGGEIGFDTEIGKGTVFYFTLPLDSNSSIKNH